MLESMNTFADDYVTQPDLLDAHERIVRTAGVLVGSVQPEQLDDPTPCGQWSVRELVAHLTDINDEYASLAETGAMPGRRPEYQDPLTAFPVQAARARAAFGAQGFLDKTIPTPIGPHPGSVTVQHVVNELAAHSWDLARALGKSTDIEPDIAENALASWKAFFDGFPRTVMQANFGEEHEAAADAPAADRLAAYLGREV